MPALALVPRTFPPLALFSPYIPTKRKQYEKAPKPGTIHTLPGIYFHSGSTGKTKKTVKKTAKKVGNKTAEVASKGKAVVTDQKHKTKVGPQGQTIYIDNHGRYYWITGNGKRQYVSEASLKPKVKD